MSKIIKFEQGMVDSENDDEGAPGFIIFISNEDINNLQLSGEIITNFFKKTFNMIYKNIDWLEPIDNDDLEGLLDYYLDDFFSEGAFY